MMHYLKPDDATRQHCGLGTSYDEAQPPVDDSARFDTSGADYAAAHPSRTPPGTPGNRFELVGERGVWRVHECAAEGGFICVIERGLDLAMARLLRDTLNPRGQS